MNMTFFEEKTTNDRRIGGRQNKNMLHRH